VSPLLNQTDRTHPSTSSSPLAVPIFPIPPLPPSTITEHKSIVSTRRFQTLNILVCRNHVVARQNSFRVQFDLKRKKTTILSIQFCILFLFILFSLHFRSFLFYFQSCDIPDDRHNSYVATQRRLYSTRQMRDFTNSYTTSSRSTFARNGRVFTFTISFRTIDNASTVLLSLVFTSFLVCTLKRG